MTDAKDLAARLRDWSEGPGTDALCAEAADLIEQQEATITKLKEMCDDLRSTLVVVCACERKAKQEKP